MIELTLLLLLLLNFSWSFLCLGATQTLFLNFLAPKHKDDGYSTLSTPTTVLAFIATAIVLFLVNYLLIFFLLDHVFFRTIFAAAAINIAPLFFFALHVIATTPDEFFFTRKLHSVVKHIAPFLSYKIYRVLKKHCAHSVFQFTSDFYKKQSIWLRQSKYAQRTLLEEAVSRRVVPQVACAFVGPFKERELWFEKMFASERNIAHEILYALEQNPDLSKDLSQEELKLFLAHPDPAVRRAGFLYAGGNAVAVTRD